MWTMKKRERVRKWVITSCQSRSVCVCVGWGGREIERERGGEERERERNGGGRERSGGGGVRERERLIL